MDRHGDTSPDVSISKIVVPTEHDREQLLLALKYIHDLRDIDTDFKAVNSLVHMYHVPDRIEVQDANELKTLVREFLGYLDAVEHSDSDTPFNPTTIHSVRCMVIERLGTLLPRMKELSIES